MQWLNLSYSVWFNRRHGRLGPVFTRPFKAVLVDGEGAWALALSRYIHLNPIRVKALGRDKTARKQEHAGVAGVPTVEEVTQRLRRLRSYRWSSYGAYAGYRAATPWLTCTVLWQRVARRGKPSAQAYREFVEDDVRRGVVEEVWSRLQAGMALGSTEFLEQVRRMAKGNRREQPALRRWERALAFESIVAATERVKGESWAAFRDRRGDAGRDIVLWLARRHCGLTLPALGAKAGGIDYLAASKAISRMGQRLEQSHSLRQLRASIEKVMSNV
jgi:hypothetical protein